MLKTSFQPASTLPDIGINNYDVVGSSNGNDGKSAKFDITKPVHGVEKPSFLTSDTI